MPCFQMYHPQSPVSKTILALILSLVGLPLLAQLSALGSEEAVLLWPRFEKEVLEPLFPEGSALGLGRFWTEADPELRRQIWRLFLRYAVQPQDAERLLEEARQTFGRAPRTTGVGRTIASFWRLRGRNFVQRPHNLGDPDPDILLLQRALNTYFLGRRQIAEDGYIRRGGETLESLRIFRQEHGLLPADKPELDDEVLLALSVYYLISQRPMTGIPDQEEGSLPQRAPPSTTVFPEMTADTVIAGLNRLIGRDLSRGQRVASLDIVALQMALRAWLGPFQPLELTGTIDPSPSDPTLRALARFQAERGLRQVPLLDEQTVEALTALMVGFRP